MQQFPDNKTQTEKTRDTLYKYQKRGLSVIPCNGKIPLIKNWQNRNASLTDSEIEERLKEWPQICKLAAIQLYALRFGRSGRSNYKRSGGLFQTATYLQPEPPYPPAA